MRRIHLSALMLAALAAAGFFMGIASASVLEIRNQSSSEILNIMIEPQNKKDGAEPIFLRLDLVPGAADKADNPGFRANLRVDTGLQLWLYKDVALEDAESLVFCPDYQGCLALRNKKGELGYAAVSLRELAPGHGSRPVCELGRFRPMMPMREVCAILEPDLPRDDNGACLTGLGFAGKLWAARLAPFQDGPITEDSLLEHMELRRKLSKSDVEETLDALYKLGYVPWQAEFPGGGMDFDGGAGLQARKELVDKAIDKFLRSFSRRPPQVNNAADEEAEASVLLAPADNLKALENADSPPEDVQLFTMILKPLSSTLLLDVTAYKGDKAN